MFYHTDSKNMNGCWTVGLTVLGYDRWRNRSHKLAQSTSLQSVADAFPLARCSTPSCLACDYVKRRLPRHSRRYSSWPACDSMCYQWNFVIGLIFNWWSIVCYHAGNWRKRSHHASLSFCSCCVKWSLWLRAIFLFSLSFSQFLSFIPRRALTAPVPQPCGNHAYGKTSAFHKALVYTTITWLG